MFKEVFLQIKTNWVAIVGAITGIAGLLLSLFNYFRDRAKILIKLKLNWKVIGEGGYYKNNTHYHEIQVINKGRRPIKIVKAGARISNHKTPWVIFSDSAALHRNQILTEENPTSEFMVEADILNFDDVYFVTAHDATGRTFKKWVHPLKYFLDWIMNAK